MGFLLRVKPDPGDQRRAARLIALPIQTCAALVAHSGLCGGAALVCLMAGDFVWPDWRKESGCRAYGTAYRRLGALPRCLPYVLGLQAIATDTGYVGAYLLNRAGPFSVLFIHEIGL